MMSSCKISIIVPAYNEESTIQDIINRINNNPALDNIDKQIIIVNDGSTDRTKEKINKSILPRYKNIVYIELSKNKGKGFAIRRALQVATGDITIIQDADLEYDPSDYPKLIAPLLSGEAKVVYGSRYLHNPRLKSANLIYKIGGALITELFNLIYRAKITDESTCYKIFETRLLKSLNLECRRFEFCPEVTAKITRLGYKIKELPISYKARSVRDGKKVRFIDALIAIFFLIKFRFYPKNKFIKKTI